MASPSLYSRTGLHRMPSPSHRKSLHLCNSEQDTTILLFLGKDSGLTSVVLLSFHIKHCVLSFIDNPEIIRREYDSSEHIKDNQPNHVGTMNESRFTSKNGKSHAWTWDYQKKTAKAVLIVWEALFSTSLNQ